MDSERFLDLAFQADGCAILTASASMLTEALKGKTKVEVKAIFVRVRNAVTKGVEDVEIGELAVLRGVYSFPARYECAMMPWAAAMEALEDGQEIEPIELTKRRHRA